jgi:hypothetical protein
MSRLHLLSLPLLVALCCPGCVPKPKQDYSVAELGKLESLEELMRVQASVADPLFAKRKQSVFSKEEFEAMYGGSMRLKATASRLRDHFAGKFGPRFSGFASQLLDGATELGNAAAAKLEQKSSAALESMKQACAGCHKAFK